MRSTRSTRIGGAALSAYGLSLLVCFVSRPAQAHDLAMDQLLVRLDPTQRELVGQLTFNPHRTPDRDGAGARDLGARVVRLVQRSVRLELDGRICQPKIEVRELWEKASPTVGDLLTLRCRAENEPRTLRVFAAEGMSSLVVSVEDDRAPAGSRSVLISGGTWTPLYVFAKPDAEWLPGGAGRFENRDAVNGTANGEVRTDTPSPLRPAAGAREPKVPNGGFAERASELARRYVWLGYLHILPKGWDHVLFVAGLVLGSFRDWRRLLWQVSAFTLAHTLTLALGALGWVVLPTDFVEPVIAFSIAYVAVENLRSGGASRSRLLVVFAFGLVHGQGFARALDHIGLSKASFLLALLSFNLGVELGQLSVIAVLLLVVRQLCRATCGERWALRPASLLIACVGVLWGVQRMLS